MYSAFASWGTLNSFRAASHLVRLVEGEEKCVAPNPPWCSSSILGRSRTESYCHLHGSQGYSLDRCTSPSLVMMNFVGLDLSQSRSGGIRNNDTYITHKNSKVERLEIYRDMFINIVEQQLLFSNGISTLNYNL
ncbi:hypothetical protein TNCV_3616751 [Trichonephila clavipes]|nr:hypothetical protein TNCV_3616751 [Trichonephila clavipes]